MLHRALLALVVLVALGAGCKKQPELPELGRLEGFALTRENGQRFGSAELQGQVWVAAFMFTRCPTVCPRITQRMRDIQRTAKERGFPLTLVSFSVDPENDTPEVLSR